MSYPLPPTLIQYRRDFIKTTIKNTVTVFFAVLFFAVPIYFVDWHILIKWGLWGVLLPLIPTILYISLQSRQIIRQDTQGITMTCGLWRRKTVRINYQDIIDITDVSAPQKRSPTILQISYHNKGVIRHQNIALCRHDMQTGVDFQIFLIHRKVINQVYKKSATPNLPLQTFYSRYYLVGFFMVAVACVMGLFLFFIGMGVYYFFELSIDRQIRLFILVGFLIFVIKSFIGGIKNILDSGTITLYPEHLLIKTIFNKEIIIKLSSLNYENIEADISHAKMFQRFYFNDVGHNFILINHHSHAQMIKDFLQESLAPN